MTILEPALKMITLLFKYLYNSVQPGGWMVTNFEVFKALSQLTPSWLVNFPHYHILIQVVFNGFIAISLFHVHKSFFSWLKYFLPIIKSQVQSYHSYYRDGCHFSSPPPSLSILKIEKKLNWQLERTLASPNQIHYIIDEFTKFQRYHCKL